MSSVEQSFHVSQSEPEILRCYHKHKANGIHTTQTTPNSRDLKGMLISVCTGREPSLEVSGKARVIPYILGSAQLSHSASTGALAVRGSSSSKRSGVRGTGRQPLKRRVLSTRSPRTCILDSSISIPAHLPSQPPSCPASLPSSLPTTRLVSLEPVENVATRHTT